MELTKEELQQPFFILHTTKRQWKDCIVGGPVKMRIRHGDNEYRCLIGSPELQVAEYLARRFDEETKVGRLADFTEDIYISPEGHSAWVIIRSTEEADAFLEAPPERRMEFVTAVTQRELSAVLNKTMNLPSRNEKRR